MQVPQHHQHNSALRERLRANLAAFQPRSHSNPQLKHAAVVLAVTRYGQEASVIITRRAGTLRAHTGQWALPGGRLDPGENPREAALREMHEEINLALDPGRILGLLDDYVTRSGYIMTPVVVWNDTPWDRLHPNPDEVACISPFGFSELARSDSPRLTEAADGDSQVLSMHFHDDVIFAPTGALLYQFREVAMHGRSTRVLHYDQPQFAWQ